jgi:hypothetical protein
MWHGEPLDEELDAAIWHRPKLPGLEGERSETARSRQSHFCIAAATRFWKGLKPSHFVGLIGTTEQLNEKRRTSGPKLQMRPLGLKPGVYFMGLMAQLKLSPFAHPNGGFQETVKSCAVEEQCCSEIP